MTSLRAAGRPRAEAGRSAAIAARQKDFCMMRVLVADDQAWLRSAMRLLLEQDPELEIVGEAVEAKMLVTKTAHAHPHLVLLDWELPGLKGTGAGQALLSELHAVCPGLRVIVMSGRPEARQRAGEAGADYFVSKADPPEVLLAALRAAKQLLQDQG